MIAGMPRTNRILAVFDPTTFPIAIPGASSNVALIAINSSGAEVPNATIVRLTMRAGMPKRRLRLTAPLTKASPANNKMTRPSADINQNINCSYFRILQPQPLGPMRNRLHV